MSNIYQNAQLERIADNIEDITASFTFNQTINADGVGDMTGATATTAGLHGFVPAPQAGDEGKFLTGAGTWEEPQSGGGVDYSLTEQDTGLKWIDGKEIYQTTFSFTAALNPPDWVQIGTISDMEQPISAEIVVKTYVSNVESWTFGYDYAKAMVQPSTGAVYYYSEQIGRVTSQFYLTVRYTKTI